MKTIGLFLIASVLAGCSTTTVQLTQYTPVPLKRADVMPTKDELAGAPPKVVIFPLSDEGQQMAARAHLGQTIANVIQTHLSGAGVDVLDRSLYGQLRKEISLAEMKGKAGAYKGPSVADYSIIGNISRADYSQSFTQPSQYMFKGKVYTTPAKCTFNAVVAGNIHFYRLPSISLVHSTAIEGKESISRDAVSPQCILSTEERSSLFREAASDAVAKVRTDVQNFFAPSGYVLERRENSEHGSIFEISIGSTAGAQQDATCEFYRTIVEKNPITGVASEQQYVIATGTVSSLIGPTYAWVVVDNDKAESIRLGDIVKFRYKEGFFEGLRNLSH